MQDIDNSIKQMGFNEEKNHKGESGYNQNKASVFPTCCDCNVIFELTGSELSFYESKG